MEIFRNRIEVEIIRKDDTDKILKEQFKLTIFGIHKSYENYDSYTIRQNQVLMDKPIYLGLAVLELSKFLMYISYYLRLQPYFGQKYLQLLFMDTDSFVLSFNTKDIVEDFKNLEDFFHFSNLNENHEIFGNENKKVISKFKIETPKNIWIDEFIALRSKMFAFRCGDESKNKLKRISQNRSKNNKFDENYNCLFGEEYQMECNHYIIRSINHDMFFEKIKKATLFIFDDKRCYINNIESVPWN